MELKKTSSGALAIARQSYKESQDRELAVMLDAMINQYCLALAPEDIRFWRVILIERARLSRRQIREGFLAYFAGPRAAFPPQPAEIITLLPEQPEREDHTLSDLCELNKHAASGEQFFRPTCGSTRRRIWAWGAVGWGNAPRQSSPRTGFPQSTN